VYDYSINTQEFTDLYTTISKYVKDNGIRISFHPGQYTLLTSENTEVTRRSIQDIRLHAYLLNKMGTKDSVIVLHGGGVYKNKQKAIERFKKNYSIIPESARQYIVLENCENCYNISDLYEIGVSVYPQIPIVIDFHHHHINPIENISELYTKIHKIWENRGIKPKFHMSNSVHGAQGNDRRKHSDIITYFYTDFKVVYDIYNLLTNGASMDLMLECKHKEQAICFLRA
jgi:UV DNA damage endonuclease